MESKEAKEKRLKEQKVLGQGTYGCVLQNPCSNLVSSNHVGKVFFKRKTNVEQVRELVIGSRIEQSMRQLRLRALWSGLDPALYYTFQHKCSVALKPETVSACKMPPPINMATPFPVYYSDMGIDFFRENVAYPGPYEQIESYMPMERGHSYSVFQYTRQKIGIEPNEELRLAMLAVNTSKLTRRSKAEWLRFYYYTLVQSLYHLYFLNRFLGVYHLDLKVDNMLFQNRYFPVWCDWGIAFLLPPLPSEGSGSSSFSSSSSSTSSSSISFLFSSSTSSSSSSSSSSLSSSSLLSLSSSSSLSVQSYYTPVEMKQLFEDTGIEKKQASWLTLPFHENPSTLQHYQEWISNELYKLSIRGAGVYYPPELNYALLQRLYQGETFSNIWKKFTAYYKEGPRTIFPFDKLVGSLDPDEFFTLLYVWSQFDETFFDQEVTDMASFRHLRNSLEYIQMWMFGFSFLELGSKWHSFGFSFEMDEKDKQYTALDKKLHQSLTSFFNYCLALNPSNRLNIEEALFRLVTLKTTGEHGLQHQPLQLDEVLDFPYFQGYVENVTPEATDS